MELEDAVLEKLASQFTDEELEALVNEAKAEAEIDKLASEFTEDELEDLIKEAQDELASESEYDEQEKLATAYYELGQIMARGFNDEIEKQAAKKTLLDKARSLAGRVGSKLKLHRLSPGARAAQAKAQQVKKYMKSGRKGTVGEMGKELLQKRRQEASKAIRKAQEVGGAATLGAGALGTSGAASYAMDKKSYDQGVYDTLAELGLLED